MPILNNPVTRFVEACKLSVFKPLFLAYYKRVISKGAWRSGVLTAINPRPHDKILEVSAASAPTYEPLLLDHLDVSYAFLSPARQQASSKRHISFENEKLGCIGASFDKAICCMALHPLAPSRKLALLRELRRVLRQGGKVYIADFDQPYSKRETIALRGTGTLFGTESANIHHEGTMAAQIKLAGFTHIKRVYNEPDLIGRVSILEARR